jgi:hypothetical protein
MNRVGRIFRNERVGKFRGKTLTPIAETLMEQFRSPMRDGTGEARRAKAAQANQCAECDIGLAAFHPRDGHGDERRQHQRQADIYALSERRVKFKPSRLKPMLPARQ